jgi:hypothetical protein
MRRVLAAIIAGAAAVASAQAADISNESRERFFKGLACRNAQVLGGQNDIGAILYHDPVSDRPKEANRFGFPIYSLNQAVQPLGVFRILPGAKKGETSRVRTTFSSNGGILAVFDYAKRGGESRFYWSPTDDLVVWNLNELWRVDGTAIRSGFPFLFEKIPAAELRTRLDYGRMDVIPEHFDQAARLATWNVFHHVPELQPHTSTLRERLSDLGPMTLFPDDQLAWTQSDVFVRLTKTESTRPTHLEVLKPGNRSGQGIPFAPQVFPHNARLLLVRDNSELKIPEALLLWRDDQSVSHIGLIRLGSAKPTIVAEGYIKKVFSYPDRTKIYGYSDHLGRFHPLSNERHKSSVAFWLEQLKRMDGLEEFYLLGNDKYAVIKRSGGTRGPEAIILERRGSTTAQLGQLCQTNAAVERIVEGPSSLLFIPKEPVADHLVVYLHDGPFASIGRDGDEITDIVAQTGTPILAINYFGSSSRLRELAVARDLAPMFAADVENAVTFARQQLPSKNLKITFLAGGFGAFVGFSSMTAEAVRPERFLILSGMVNARRIFNGHAPDRDPFELNFLTRAGRQLGSVMTPPAASTDGPQFLFIHGDKDETAPHADVVQFAKRLNETPNSVRSEISVVPNMGHSPETRKDYETVLAAIGNFIRAP